jgi:hypothetical protein
MLMPYQTTKLIQRSLLLLDVVVVVLEVGNIYYMKDYKKVFQEVRKIAGPESKIKEFVSDYERAIWRGVEDDFPKASMFGCAFHWTQAVFRRLKKIGLVNLYNQKGEVYILLKKLLSLHLLPFEKISKMFADLKSQSLSLDVNLTQANLLKKFLDYVEKQWITNPICED